MTIDNIKKVVIVGSGTMGQQIGTQCAIHGFDVAFYDMTEEILRNAKERTKKLIEYYVKRNRVRRDEADQALNRINFTTDIQKAAEKADFISESVPEDPELKGSVLSQFNDLCPSHTIFTTNTSTLLPSQFAEKSGRPDRLAALHFHDLRTTNVVDVMAHPGTSEVTFNLVYEFARKNGLIPIVLKKESSGYVFNAMLTALFRAAQTLAANGVTTVEEIDRAWMGIMNTSIGPFGIMDSIGLETVWKVDDYWAKNKNDEQVKKNADFMKEYVDKGYLGQKSGQGFYSYPGPAFRDPDFIVGKKDD